MFAYFSSAGITNNNHAINALIALLESDIKEVKSESVSENFVQLRSTPYNFNTSEECGTLFDITRFIPLWVLYEKENKQNRGETAITIYDFLQKYYDWLYCDAASGAQYGISNNILDNIDIKKTKDKLLENIYNVYGESFNGIFNSNTLSVGRIELENFITGIRRNFYHRKGTEEGIRKILTTLFVIDETDIQVEIPKRFILRLNGGKFADPNFQFRTDLGDTGDYLVRGDLAGSYLNYSRIQDSTWFHDYSYLLFVGDKYSENEELLEIYKKSNHPAGVSVIFGKQISDFEPGNPDEEDGVVCEYPMLKNYAPYKIGGTYPALGKISGATYFGITACVGCCGISYAGFTGPTFRFPNWTNLFNADEFKDINILNFIFFCYDGGLTSPNDNLTCTGCP